MWTMCKPCGILSSILLINPISSLYGGRLDEEDVLEVKLQSVLRHFYSQLKSYTKYVD